MVKEGVTEKLSSVRTSVEMWDHVLGPSVGGAANRGISSAKALG